jgi:hypothetical protein
MRRLTLSLALAAALPAIAPALFGQVPDAQTASSAATCPTTATLDDLIKATDAAVSGPANKDRTCFRALFLPDARLIPIRVGADGTSTPRVLTVDDWINAVAKRGSDVFYEKQIKVGTETYGHMAHLWSTYETRTSPDGKPPEGKVLDRGINSIQAIFDGKQWHVLQIVWQAESPTERVPEKYLP